MDFKRKHFWRTGAVLCLFGVWYTGHWLTDQTQLLTQQLRSKFRKTDDIQQKQERDHNENDTGEPSDVLILTYMRSGSSFLGTLLGWRNDTFYWYEPLWETHTWAYISKDGQICSYGNSSCTYADFTDRRSLNKSLQFLLDIYRCNNLMYHYSRFTKSLAGSRFAGPTGRVYSDCSKADRISEICKNCNKSAVNCSQCKLEAEKSCYIRFVERCSTSKHRVTKVLRMDTGHAKYLLRHHKRLKLIQIFRDPRGIINSRVKTKWYYRSKFTLLEDVKRLCSRMEKNLASAENLRKLFPGRVKILQYEDFNDSLSLGTKLYDFLNMELTHSAKSILISPSKKRLSDGFHPDSFRYYFNWTMIQSVDRSCYNVLRRLGLRIFKNESELHDATQNIVPGSLPYALDG